VLILITFWQSCTTNATRRWNGTTVSFKLRRICVYNTRPSLLVTGLQVTNAPVKKIAKLLRIKEVTGSNLRPGTRRSNMFRSFAQTLKLRARQEIQNTPQLLPSTLFRIHYSPDLSCYYSILCIQTYVSRWIGQRQQQKFAARFTYTFYFTTKANYFKISGLTCQKYHPVKEINPASRLCRDLRFLHCEYEDDTPLGCCSL
jgi:hypothetical protein